MTRLWTQVELERLSTIYPTTNPKDLESFFPGMTKATIQQRANRMGLRRKDDRSINKLLDGSLESCYWLGFILADGWLTEKFTTRKVCTFGITLSEKDRNHLKRLGEYLNVPVNSYSRRTNMKEEFTYYNITVNDNINVPLIKERFSISNDKSHNPPDLSGYQFTDEQMIALIAGYIDGDGSFAVRTNNRSVISIQCNAAWSKNLTFILHKLSTFFNVETRNGVSINSRGHASVYIGNQEIVKGLKQFVLDHNLPVLARKWISNTEFE